MKFLSNMNAKLLPIFLGNDLFLYLGGNILGRKGVLSELDNDNNDHLWV